MNLATPLENDDATQFFKEERLPDVVFNVFLKKVRYHTPSEDGGVGIGLGDSTSAEHSTWYLNSPLHPADSNVSLLQWRTVDVKVLKSGTVERLVENLSSETGEIDSTYVNVFLATYRSFTTTKDVLSMLLARYVQIREDPNMKQEAKEAHRKTIRIVISVWLDGYPDDFRDPPTYPCLRQLVQFANHHMEGNDLAHRAQHRIEKFRKEEETPPIVSIDDIEFTFNFMDFVTAPFQENQDSHGLTRPLEFESIPEKIFAEQLTYMDSELFKKVVAHHCLGSIWSRRDKKRAEAPSVYATVNQFNAVSYRVVATVLKHPMDIMRPQRANIIERWIEIAQELRFLKNFSSLKAIISGLQSNPVYRLQRVWADVDRESMAQFDELASIFSEDNNQMTARELLMKEGTAKFADSESTISKKKRAGMSIGRKKQEQNFSISGTIPYLGTFLTDLTMIDAANSDTTEDGLINFDKRRKEFEVLAQIKLLQSSASMYQMRPDQAFMEWFHSMRTYDDSESFELSCEIEPPTPSTPKEPRGHRKKPSLGFFTPRRPATVMVSDSIMTSLPLLVTSTPCDSTDGSITSEPSTPANENLRTTSIRHSISMCSLKSEDSASLSPWRSPESCVATLR